MTLHENQFYCVKCKRKEVVANPANISVKHYKRKSRSGKKLTTVALVGDCAKCHTKLHKFVKHDDVKHLEQKYRKRSKRRSKSKSRRRSRSRRHD